ncbi:MAG TPA: BtrH N-terminal domain-containing protein [Anaerolineae bacterium]|nr:BtrH N-terminal domain-containing protein [Anaerolineae bacterium]
MPTLQKYRHFAGRHWETGSICNYFAYRGVQAPHTGQPLSEALLLGVSGGIVLGYFSFAYQGYDPHVVILTRNTFSPLDTLLTRLGVVQHVLQTANADKARANLIATLEDGDPALVWADIYSLPYNALPFDKGMWGAYPILVFGYDEEQDTVSIADRANVPLTVTPAELAAARARIKKDKFRLMTLEPPDMDKLPIAVQQGIWDTLKRYTEAPVAKAKNNFGFAGFQRWADLLTQPKQKLSWEREFPAGPKMYAGLTTTYQSVALGAGQGQAERDVYADFLDEASAVLGRPALKPAAEQFRASGRAWRELSHALLPDAAPAFKETRERMWRKHQLFIGKGGAALPEIREVNARLDALKAQIATQFPLTPAEVAAMRENLRTRVLNLAELEREAHQALEAAMANGARHPRPKAAARVTGKRVTR